MFAKVASIMLALLLAPAAIVTAQETPLPLEHGPTGILFRIHAPNAREAFVAGTFNGWAASDGYTVSDPLARMYGPDERGVFEKFYPLTPGNHIFKFCVDGYKWLPGPPDLPRAKDNFDLTPGQQGMMGSMFEFSLVEPPWPSYVPTREMMPVVMKHQETGEEYLRIRFFSRQAKTVHIVGSWNNWDGVDGREVSHENHLAQSGTEPYFFQRFVGPIWEGPVEYKIIVNNRMWLSDPTVVEMSDDGNTRVHLARHQGVMHAYYTPRFHPDARRRATQSRWGNDINWMDDRSAGFQRAAATKTKMLWVITLPQSRLSQELMVNLNKDEEALELLRPIICLETAANEVEDILRQQRIYRLPHVIIVDSNYRPAWQAFNPSVEEVKTQLRQIE